MGGTFTLLIEDLAKAKAFKQNLKLILAIARELDALVMVSNFGKVDDFKGNPVLCLPEDPILRLYMKNAEVSLAEDSPLRLSTDLIYMDEE